MLFYIYSTVYQISLIITFCFLWNTLSYVDRIHLRERARKIGISTSIIFSYILIKKFFYDKFRFIIIKPLCALFEIIIGFLEGLENFEATILLSDNNHNYFKIKVDETSDVKKLNEHSSILNIENKNNISVDQIIYGQPIVKMFDPDFQIIDIDTMQSDVQIIDDEFKQSDVLKIDGESKLSDVKIINDDSKESDVLIINEKSKQCDFQSIDNISKDSECQIIDVKAYDNKFVDTNKMSKNIIEINNDTDEKKFQKITTRQDNLNDALSILKDVKKSSETMTTSNVDNLNNLLKSIDKNNFDEMNKSNAPINLGLICNSKPNIRSISRSISSGISNSKSKSKSSSKSSSRSSSISSSRSSYRSKSSSRSSSRSRSKLIPNKKIKAIDHKTNTKVQKLEKNVNKSNETETESKNNKNKIKPIRLERRKYQN